MVLLDADVESSKLYYGINLEELKKHNSKSLYSDAIRTRHLQNIGLCHASCF